MKKRSLSLFAAALCISAPCSLMAQGVAEPSPAAESSPPKAEESSAGGQGGRREKTPLGKEMESLNRNLRTLGRQVTDPAKKDSSLQLISQIETSVVGTHSLSPASVSEIPEADRAAYLAKFHERMTELHEKIGKLKEAVIADKPDDAKKVLSEMQQLKKKGHEEFNVDDAPGPRRP